MSKGELFRQARIWHGYLSALAFAAMLFFAVTGLMLNHPGWLKVETAPPVRSSLTLSATELAAVKTAKAPAEALVATVGPRIKLVGALKDSDVSGADLFVRLQGVRGSSDLRADLDSGRVTATVEADHPVSVLNGLHRASLAGAPWRFFVDAAAIALILVSLIGLVLFFSLRMRLKSSLALIAAGIAAMVGLFLLTVP